MSTQEVNVVGYLNVLFQQVTQAHANYVAKPDPKRTERLDVHLTEYLSKLEDFLKQGAVASDPFGIVTKTHIPAGIGHQMIDRIVSRSECITLSLQQMRGDIEGVASQDLSNVTILDKVRGVKTKAKGILSNGVSYLFDAETGKLRLMYRGVKRYIMIMFNGVIQAWNWILNKIKGAFNVCKEAVFGKKDEKAVSQTEVSDSGCELQPA
jgi:hypothetical protein